MAQTKRPHFVPAGYLRAWADDADQVAVRRRGSADVHTPNVINVAVDAGIYGRGACGQAREDMFRQLEDMWPLLRANLLARGGTLTSDDRDAVAVFAALQLVRTREHVAQTEFLASFAEFTSRRPITREDMRTYLTERHLKFEPSDSEVEGAWTLAYVALKNGPPPSKDETLAVSLDAAVRVIAPTLARLRWSVEHCRKPILFTSDRPVMCWRAPSARDHYEGVGIDTATEIRMPLTPYDLLAMRPDGFDLGVVDVQPKRFQRINAGVATQCHEFLLSLPARQAELRQLPLAIYRPVLRFNIAPGVRQRPDGTHEPIGDVDARRAAGCGRRFHQLLGTCCVRHRPPLLKRITECLEIAVLEGDDRELHTLTGVYFPEVRGMYLTAAGALGGFRRAHNLAFPK